MSMKHRMLVEKHTINKDGRQYYIFQAKICKRITTRIDEGDVQGEELSNITKSLSKPEEEVGEVEKWEKWKKWKMEEVSDDELFTAVRESYFDFLTQYSRNQLRSKVQEKIHSKQLTRVMKDKIQDFGIQINELLQSDLRKMQKVDKSEINNMQAIIDRQHAEITHLKQQMKDSPGIEIIDEQSPPTPPQQSPTPPQQTIIHGETIHGSKESINLLEQLSSDSINEEIQLQPLIKPSPPPLIKPSPPPLIKPSPPPLIKPSPPPLIKPSPPPSVISSPPPSVLPSPSPKLLPSPSPSPSPPSPEEEQISHLESLIEPHLEETQKTQGTQETEDAFDVFMKVLDDAQNAGHKGQTFEETVDTCLAIRSND